jgi:hypothetical protein
LTIARNARTLFSARERRAEPLALVIVVTSSSRRSETDRAL